MCLKICEFSTEPVLIDIFFQEPLSVREPLLPETEMDNAWFSLSLGGGDGLVEPAPAPSLPTTSQELRPPTFQVRSRDFESHGRGMS